MSIFFMVTNRQVYLDLPEKGLLTISIYIKDAYLPLNNGYWLKNLKNNMHYASAYIKDIKVVA